MTSTATPPPLFAAAAKPPVWANKPQGRPLQRRTTAAALAFLGSKKSSNTFESLDYDEAENDLVRKATALPDEERIRIHRKKTVVMWALVVTTGFSAGSVAFLSTFVVEKIVTWKFDLLAGAVSANLPFKGYAILSGFVLVLALLGALLTRWAPESAGSGIPHVKAYLNGNKLDGAFRLRSLVAKVAGIICCVASGMPAGREGPMVQSGAILANIGVGWFGRWFSVELTTTSTGATSSRWARPPA